VRVPRSWLCAAAGAALAPLALTGCSGGSTPNRIHGARLTIYAGIPLEGASNVSGEAMLNGASIALDQVSDRIGRYHVVFRTLDDATVKAGGWDPAMAQADARIVAADHTAVGYIGDFNSGASAISIPLLNRARIAQISATNTAVGLTTAAPGSSPGEPQKYYPTGIRTYVRVVPNDTVQANAQVQLEQSLDCTRTFVVDDGEVDGLEGAMSFAAAAQTAGLQIAGVQSFPPHANDYTSFAAGVAATAPDCIMISARTEAGAPLVTEQLAAALPHALILGCSGLAESTYVDPALGGIPAALDRRVLVMSPMLGLPDYPPAAADFLRRYTVQFGPPEPTALFGYEAMNLLLHAIARATHGGRGPVLRSRVIDAMFATHDRDSVLGNYSIDPNGDTTIRSYGVWRVVDGRLVFWKALQG
jgi:branched-chain amino acid transport system substrate-binding protein